MVTRGKANRTTMVWWQEVTRPRVAVLHAARTTIPRTGPWPWTNCCGWCNSSMPPAAMNPASKESMGFVWYDTNVVASMASYAHPHPSFQSVPENVAAQNRRRILNQGFITGDRDRRRVARRMATAMIRITVERNGNGTSSCKLREISSTLNTSWPSSSKP